MDAMCGREGPVFSDYSKEVSLEEFCQLQAALNDFIRKSFRKSHEIDKVWNSLYNTRVVLSRITIA